MQYSIHIYTYKLHNSNKKQIKYLLRYNPTFNMIIINNSIYNKEYYVNS